MQEGTPAYGQLHIGDTILTVNGRPVKSLRNFYQVMRIAHPIANIAVKRPRTKEEMPAEVRTDPEDNLPPEIRQVITRRPGYHYQAGTPRNLNDLTESSVSFPLSSRSASSASAESASDWPSRRGTTA